MLTSKKMVTKAPEEEESIQSLENPPEKSSVPTKPLRKRKNSWWVGKKNS
jgi:hypothetical protein